MCVYVCVCLYLRHPEHQNSETGIFARWDRFSWSPQGQGWGLGPHKESNMSMCVCVCVSHHLQRGLRKMPACSIPPPPPPSPVYHAGAFFVSSLYTSSLLPLRSHSPSLVRDVSASLDRWRASPRQTKLCLASQQPSTS